MTVNQRVAGSSPASGALQIKALQKCEAFLFSDSDTFPTQTYY
jgi:hypothetical protein